MSAFLDIPLSLLIFPIVGFSFLIWDLISGKKSLLHIILGMQRDKLAIDYKEMIFALSIAVILSLTLNFFGW